MVGITIMAAAIVATVVLPTTAATTVPTVTTIGVPTTTHAPTPTTALATVAMVAGNSGCVWEKFEQLSSLQLA